MYRSESNCQAKSRACC